METKRIESRHFKLFRELAEYFPNGEVWHEDKPDFLIHEPQSVIGVEHSLVHLPHRDSASPLQAIESQTDEIVALAQEHAELRGTPEVHAKFVFNLGTAIKKKQRLEFARELAKIVHAKVAQPDPIPEFSRIEIGWPDLPQGVTAIHLTKVNKSLYHRWICARAGWVVEDCREIFQIAINQKALKYDDYLKRCSECWLLLVADSNPSGFLHANKDTTEHIFKSPFAKTYILDCSLRKLQLLHTQYCNG